MNKFDLFLEKKGINKTELAKKSGEEITGVYGDFMASLNDEIEDAVKAKASAEDIIQLKKDQADLAVKQMKEINKLIEELNLKIVAREGGAVQKVNFASSLKKGLEDNKEHLAKLKTGETREWLRLKVAGDMTFANVSGGNIPVEDRIEGLNIVPSRGVKLLDLMSKRQTMANVVSWVYQANKDGAAGQTAEGTTKNQIDFDLVVANEPIKKTTAFIKVSDEMLDDVPFMQSEIEAELMRELLKAVETQAYSGDGTGSNLNGISTQASAFSAAAGLGADSVDSANIADVLVSAMLQIELAQEGGLPNYILMNPKQVAALKVFKVTATDKRYVERLVQVGSNLVLDGVPIIPTTLIADDAYLVGDFSKAILVTKDAISIEVGLDGNDFTKNFRTIRAEWRGACIVKNNDTSCFVKGVFTTDAAALETP